ncbi:MAG: diguanylate cyclase [Pseudomonadota bacterium]
MARRVLLIDESATRRIVLQAKLTGAGYMVDVSENVGDALSLMGMHGHDALILSASLPDPTGRKLPAMLATGPTRVRIPILVLAGPEGPGAARLSHGPQIDAVLDSPMNDALLLARLRSVLRVRDMEEELLLRTATCREMGLAEAAAPFHSEGRFLFVSPDEPVAESGLNALLRDRMEAVRSRDLMADIERLGDQDVVLLDARAQGDIPAIQILSELRCRAETRHASLVVHLTADAQSEAAMALDLGANDVVLGAPDPLALSALLRRQLRHKQRIDRLRNQVSDGLKLAVTDPLTGLYNRRYALNHLGRLAQRTAGTGRKFAVMVLDLDRFKSVNDDFGHAAGDAVLVAVAGCLQDNLRGADLVARFGGEEFLVAMPDTDEFEAQTVADRLRRKVAEMTIPTRGGQNMSVTLSIGLAVRDGTSNDPQGAVQRAIGDADRALYGAKSGGRNKVTLSREVAA